MANKAAARETEEEKYKNFHRRVEQYVTDAEDHLDVPRGTIGGTFDDTDFVFVLKMCGVIEPLIKEAVRESVRRAIEHPKTATSGSDALMKAIGDFSIDRLRIILFEFGWLDKKSDSFIQALFAIRNRYSHHIANAPLSVRQLCEKIGSETNGDKRLAEKLIGWGGKSSPPKDFIEHLRVFMFYNVAFFLKGALNIVKPLPSGGLLSEAFSEIERGRD